MGESRIAAAVAAGLVVVLALLGAAVVRACRKRLAEVLRDTRWVLEVADTIGSDVRRATREVASAPGRDGVFGVLDRLIALEREANGLCARPREVLSSLDGVGYVAGWKAAHELRGIVLRLVLVRTRADIALRELGDLLAARQESQDGVATMP